MPESTVIVWASLLNARTLFIFSKEIIIDFPDWSGVAAPQRLVFPPWGTTSILFLWANLSIEETSLVLTGLNTATACPTYCSLQSLTYLACSSLSKIGGVFKFNDLRELSKKLFCICFLINDLFFVRCSR